MWAITGTCRPCHALVHGLPVHVSCRHASCVQFHPCDKRRSITELSQQFPGADFSLISDDEDKLWTEDIREDPICLEVRRVVLLFMELTALFVHPG